MSSNIAPLRGMTSRIQYQPQDSTKSRNGDIPGVFLKMTLLPWSSSVWWWHRVAGLLRNFYPAISICDIETWYQGSIRICSQYIASDALMPNVHYLVSVRWLISSPCHVSIPAAHSTHSMVDHIVERNASTLSWTSQLKGAIYNLTRMLHPRWSTLGLTDCSTYISF